MKTNEVLSELKSLGSDSVKKIYLKHGAKEPFYGVKIADLKKLQRKVRENQQQVALELYSSGIGDAQYLAGLMADGSKMSTKELKTWADKAEWPMISECSVAWVACENKEAMKLALEWIDSSKSLVACTGWNTVSSLIATKPDSELDIAAIRKLLTRVEKEITKAPNRVRYCMNSFVIAVGSHVKELTPEATHVGKKIGNVEVDMNGTACKVPFAPDYIQKVIDKGYHGKKKKTAKC